MTIALAVPVKPFFFTLTVTVTEREAEPEFEEAVTTPVEELTENPVAEPE